MGCIYRALKRLGAEWVVQNETPPASDSEGDEDDEDCHDELHYSDDEDSHGHRHDEHRHTSPAPKKRRPTRVPAPRRAPKDPWIIQARWRKFAPTRRADDPLTAKDAAAADAERDEDCVYVHLTIQLYQLEHDNYLVDFKCAGYERLEVESDDKARKKVGFEEELGGDDDGGRLKEGREGNAAKEDYKEVNSPFPFLDAAGALIIALADTAD